MDKGESDYYILTRRNVAVKIRNKCIPGYTEAEIFKRVDEVDRVNAEKVEESKVFADHVVKSGAV